MLLNKNLLDEESVEVVHRGRTTRTTVFSNLFEALHVNPENFLDLKKGRIPMEFANRSDLVADLFLGSHELYWLIHMVNSVEDPFEEFNSGDTVLIPKI
tara:strand:- start:44 stop:340 length:297 start_codon:yes stop_codon:yes gene_type:complete